MITVHVNVVGGPASKLRWHPSTPDSSVAQLVCGAVGLESGTNIILKDSEDFLVPCCGHLTSGATYTVLEAPVRTTKSRTSEHQVKFNASGAEFESRSSINMPRLSEQPSLVGRSRSTSEIIRTTLATHSDLNQASLASLPERQLSSIIEPILDNRMTKFERLSSHLANERTFLAWVRTAVAVAGLAVTYSSLASHHHSSTYWGGCSFTWVTGLVVFVVGCSRYYKVKQILGLAKSEISERFHRTGINYIVVMFGIFLGLMSIEYLASCYRDIN